MVLSLDIVELHPVDLFLLPGFPSITNSYLPFLLAIIKAAKGGTVAGVQQSRWSQNGMYCAAHAQHWGPPSSSRAPPYFFFFVWKLPVRFCHFVPTEHAQ